MKFNMARLVTRVTSKNFCVTEPSFELEAVKGEGGTPLIKYIITETLKYVNRFYIFY